MNQIVLIVCFFTFLGCNSQKDKDLNKKQKSVPTIEVVKAEYKNSVQNLNISGTILANEDVELKSEISGRVTKILFSEGSNVTKGQLLVKIDEENLLAELKINQIQIDQLSDDEKRKHELLKMNGISKEEYEQTEYKLKTLVAQRDLLKVQLSKTEIRAPFFGVIGLRMISEGAFINNSTPITTIQQIDKVKLDFFIPEKFLEYIKIGKFIDFSTSSTIQNFKAKVYAIESKIDVATRSIKIRAICNNDKRLLIPGAFAKVYLPVEQNKLLLLLTSEAIVPTINGQQVFLIKNGKTIAKSIEVGMRTNKEVEIVEGVNPGDSIAVSGLMMLKDGMTVKTIIKPL